MLIKLIKELILFNINQYSIKSFQVGKMGLHISCSRHIIHVHENNSNFEEGICVLEK